MVVRRIVNSLKYIVALTLCCAVLSVILCLIADWEFGLAFFFLSFVATNVYGCYMSFKIRDAMQSLVFFLVFALVGCALAALVTLSLMALGKPEFR